MNRFGRVIALGVLAAGLIGGSAYGLGKSRQTPPGESPPVTAGPPAVDGTVVRFQVSGPAGAPEVRGDEPAVRLAWSAPSEVRVNHPAPYSLKVVNTGTQPVQKVVVQVRVPNGVTASDTDPPARTVGGVLMWELGTLATAETRELKLRLASPARGDLTAQAWVTFTGSSSVTVPVREPQLQAFIDVPESVEIGTPICIKYGVRNTGDTRADRVVVKMTPIRSWAPNVLNVLTNVPAGGAGDSMEPGGIMAVETKLLADAPGTVTYELEATGADGLRAATTAKVKVLAPKLDVVMTGPPELGLTRAGSYTVKVTNTGDLRAEDVRLKLELGTGIRRDGAIGVNFDLPGQGIQVPADPLLFSLNPGETRTLTIDGTAVRPGDTVHKVIATEKRGITTTSECRTLVRGIPGIRMEVIDTVDPVRTGDETVYEVRVSNTGTDTDRNLKLRCELPPDMKLVDVTGPVSYLEKIGVSEINGRMQKLDTVEFDPVRELGPRTEVVFRIKVKIEKAGNSRFKAVLTSDHLTTPVAKEESTTAYGE